MDDYERTAQLYEQAAERLHTAARHCEIAARHLREKDVPRGCAHAFAAQGDLLSGRAALDDVARLHASKSSSA